MCRLSVFTVYSIVFVVSLIRFLYRMQEIPCERRCEDRTFGDKCNIAAQPNRRRDMQSLRECSKRTKGNERNIGQSTEFVYKRTHARPLCFVESIQKPFQRMINNDRSKHTKRMNSMSFPFRCKTVAFVCVCVCAKFHSETTTGCCSSSLSFSPFALVRFFRSPCLCLFWLCWVAGESGYLHITTCHVLEGGDFTLYNHNLVLPIRLSALISIKRNWSAHSACRISL